MYIKVTESKKLIYNYYSSFRTRYQGLYLSDATLATQIFIDEP